MTLHKIIIPTPFAVGDVNSYLLKGDLLTLIDAGPKTPEAWLAIKAGLKEFGVEPGDIEQVVLTHHHPDHAGWVDGFENAKLYGHPYNDLWLRRDQGFFEYHDAFYMERLKEEGVPGDLEFWVKKMKRPLNLMGSRPLDMAINEGDVLPGHPEWQVLETLGHAQSHLSFWNKETREMIGGDHVIAKVSSNPLIEPPLDPAQGRPKSLLQYNASLSRLLKMPIDVIYSGHGEEVHNVNELITNRLAKQHQRAMKALGMIGERQLTVYELTKELFAHAYEKELGLTLSETIGQIDYLLEEGLISERLGDDGIFYYNKV
ncbi:glyoxylase-like metal-dependent hydrolase (beta-lactamase superfamily II) [Planomicrobium stackebrandtii]|uniref:Glyoxylase-like metal-dependent hydrolase (Beta-lactamase superfamily II) n=1 Tax=Planomicrobium stackebrandtii TaxID=253160 RepID=A0ABU0GXL1_9BACL|nr:MBL fold metallo-hydrolase [Planomicrobium stackebrandtii]MDQ0430111.1 glyoxylase-like metal-dependent hydrolase (beta-lactamase superfamily II) [Planomicrobium stackebrandtii]